MVDEVLLELVEHDDHVAAVRPRARGDRRRQVGRRRRGAESGLLPQRRRERRGGVAAPVGVKDEDEVVERAQARGDARVEQRALADAALAEEEGQARREQVRRDELGVGLAAEEVGRVGLLVPRESFVGRLPGRRRDTRSLGDWSGEQLGQGGVERRTYSSSGTSSTSTPRRSQNSRSSSDGRSWIAHDLYFSFCAPQIRCRITRRFQSRMP